MGVAQSICQGNICYFLTLPHSSSHNDCYGIPAASDTQPALRSPCGYIVVVVRSSSHTQNSRSWGETIGKNCMHYPTLHTDTTWVTIPIHYISSFVCGNVPFPFPCIGPSLPWSICYFAITLFFITLTYIMICIR